MISVVDAKYLVEVCIILFVIYFLEDAKIKFLSLFINNYKRLVQRKYSF